MPRVHPLTTAFNAGELSPRLAARTDFVKYPNGLETALNVIPLSEGGIMRRAGTRYVTAVADSTVQGRLMGLQFSPTDVHPLEFGDEVLRFYRHQGIITVPTTDAAISNGTFDSAITGWDDRSTGGTAISHGTTGATIEGTFEQPDGGTDALGDGVANAANGGFKFLNSSAGTLASVRIKIASVSTAFDCTATLYSDSSGSPGASIGSASGTVTLDGTGIKTFTFGTPPSVSADTNYWIVLTDVSAGAGQVNLTEVADQGSSFATGKHDTITSIVDAGSADDWKIEINVFASNYNGLLSLDGDGSDIAWAEQDVTSSNLDQVHVVKFRVLGIPGDEIELRVGEVSTGGGLVNDLVLGVGYHAIAFTPTVSPFYVQFRNKQNKSIYVDDVSIISGGALTLTTPYPEADLAEITAKGEKDVVYLFHQEYPVYKLKRRALQSWSLEEAVFEDGPYLDENTTSTTLTPSATTGSATVTASATTGINDGAGFSASDVGRSLRIDNHGTTNWGWGRITAVASTTSITVQVERAFATTDADTEWRLGAFSEFTGWPRCGELFEQRLYMAGTTAQPRTFWASQTGLLDVMSPDSANSSGVWDGTVEADDGLDYTIDDEIFWLSAGEDTLVIGGAAAEWVPASTEGAITADATPTVRAQTTHGSASAVQPIRIDSIVLFLQRAGRRVREFGFSFESDGYVSPDMSRLAYHITRGGITGMAYTEEPESIVWMVRGDGSLLSMTFRRDEDVVGWAGHVIGGSFGSGNAVVESICSVPGADGSGQVQDSSDRDELWMIVKRTIDGNTVRYVEFMECDFEKDVHDQEDAYYADSLITYDSTSTSSISGADHLEGEGVKIWGDGAILPDSSVVSGSVALASAVSVAQIGLAYTHRVKSLKIEGGNPAGTAVGKTKRIYGITFVVLASHLLRFGPDDNHMHEIDFREVADEMDTAVPLFTGEKFVEFDGPWASDTRVIFESDEPAPFTLLAMAPELSVNPLK